MTNWITTVGRNLRYVAWLPVVTLALSIGTARGAPGSLYAGPATDPAFVTIAPRLLTAVYPDQRLNAASVADSRAALEQVASDSSSAAVTDLATMVAFAAANHMAADRLEFHGPLEQHCLLGFARRDGWVHAVSDLTAAGNAPQPTVGLAGPGAAGLFAIMRRLDPGLANIAVQPGAVAELTNQVASGAPDVLILEAYPDLQRTLIEHLADDDRLTLLPIVTRLLSRAAFDRKDGFIMQAIRTDSGLAPWSRPKLVTFCTPVGVVLRGDAPPALRDAMIRAVPTVSAALHPSLTDRAGTAATDTMNSVLDAVQGVIGRLRANN